MCNSPNATCDITTFPYTGCAYCEDGECKSGCGSDGQCPAGYHCTDHLCRGDSGKVPLRSVTLQTSLGCTSCTVEGVVVALLGETNGHYPGGVPCATATLDHAATIDFAAANSSTTFDGTLDGEDEEEKAMLGSCYQAPLNGQVSGGQVSWVGAPGDWMPGTLCVDWLSDNFAWACQTEWAGPDTWSLVDCATLNPTTRCAPL